MDEITLLAQLVGLKPEDLVIISAALWAFSEALSLIPKVKSNGVLQLVFAVLKKLARK